MPADQSHDERSRATHPDGSSGEEYAASQTPGSSLELATDLQQLRSAEAELRSELSSLKDLNADLLAELKEERAQLQMVQASTIARGMILLQGKLARLPAPARLVLRRAILTLWWATTPHLTRRRLAIWRARRSDSGSNSAASLTAPDQANPPSAFLAKAKAAVISTLAADAPLHQAHASAIDFTPLPAAAQDATKPVDRNGTYSFKSGSGGYVYIPPHHPGDAGQLSQKLEDIRFSIVVPIFNTDPDLLHRMVASVRAQWHSAWELILVDDASTDERTRVALSELKDPRIRVQRASTNGGISAATNIAISLATNDFVVFLDHDDELTIDCLHELASCIVRENPDFIYSDEDKIDIDGRYTQPFFKPDWSPDTMMSTMFTCHVMCVRRSLIADVGGLRSEFDGAQDYDLVLRLVERTTRIAHIARVLYHWRIIPASVATDLSAKPYAIDASRRAREAALVRRQLPGRVEPVPQMPVYFRVNYGLRGTPKITIIIPTKNNAAVVERCVESIYNHTRYSNFEIMIIDNGSTQADAVALLKKFEWQPRTRTHIHAKPFNYSNINNTGANITNGDILVFLNDDTEVLLDDWLERLGGYAQLRHIGAVGAKLLYPETLRVQHNGVLNLDQGPSHALHNMLAHEPGPFMRNLLEWNWAAVTGACLMIERKKFLEVGGFDESFPIAYNDVKLCFDLRDRGYYHVVCSAVELIHHESLSRGVDHHSPEKLARLERERARLYAACPQHFMRDPFHNPNLSASGVNFELP